MSNDALSTVTMSAYSPRAADAANHLPKKAVAIDTARQSQTGVPEAADPAAVKAAASQIESYLKSAGRELEFRVDEGSGQMVVSVRDASSGELIRQIPGEAALRMARQLKESKPSLVSLTV